MFYWKNVIKASCLLACFISIVLTFYEIYTVNQQVQVVKMVIPKQPDSETIRSNREARGYIKLRQFQLVTKHEINRRYFATIIKDAKQSKENEYVPYREYVEDNCLPDDSTSVGQITIDNRLTCDEVISYLESNHLDIQYGGHWLPNNCSRHSLGIIVPYRDRQQHLCVLLRYLIPMLKRQQIDFRIIIVEQAGNSTFNKGKLMNAAFIESTKLFNFRCVVFHDVDLIPENDRNIYPCPWQPTHLSVAIDEMNYRLQYEMLVGGVLAMRRDQFKTVNGFSNEFWGWGGEDDDMAYRILLSGLRILRPPTNIARFKMLRHTKQIPAAWKSRIKLLSSVNRRFLNDGLNSAKYSVEKYTEHRFYTHYLINVGEPPS